MLDGKGKMPVLHFGMTGMIQVCRNYSRFAGPQFTIVVQMIFRWEASRQQSTSLLQRSLLLSGPLDLWRWIFVSHNIHVISSTQWPPVHSTSCGRQRLEGRISVHGCSSTWPCTPLCIATDRTTNICAGIRSNIVYAVSWRLQSFGCQALLPYQSSAARPVFQRRCRKLGSR